jgi:hypothetical protein
LRFFLVDAQPQLFVLSFFSSQPVSSFADARPHPGPPPDAPSDRRRPLNPAASADRAGRGEVIADCDGDLRAAVNEFVAIIGALLEENRALAAAVSPGYARRSPR